MRINIGGIPAMAKQYRQFMGQFNDMFVGRDREIDMMTFSLIQREHILLFGPPGTTKTALSDAVFSGITGADTFAVEFSKFMSEDSVFGPYDVKKMRDEGKLEHRIEGMLPQAQFARFGEMLDANGALLRSVLGALNERRMVRGTQIMNMPLMTVYCDTNIEPGEYLRRNPQAWAVLDRIMFLGELFYIEDGKLLGEMVNRFQAGLIKKPNITIPVSVIEQLSELVVTPPSLITDPSIGNTFGHAFSEYREERKKLSDEDASKLILPDVSDRRFVKSSQMLEVQALLSGRLQVIPEDITAAGWVLCQTKPEIELWKKIAERHILKHKQNSESVRGTEQGLALKAISDQLEREVLDPNNGKNAAHVLQVLWEQFQSITPTDNQVQTYYDELRPRFKQAAEIVRRKALEDTGIGEDIGE